MNRKLFCTLAVCLVGALLAPSAFATATPIGYVSFDVTGLNVAQFDINNETGPNSTAFPDPTFPVTTSVSLSNLNLDIQYATGPDLVFGPSSGYFSLSLDGLSYDGTALSTGVDQFSNGLSGAMDAILTGTLDTTSLTLNDGSTINVDSSFSTEIYDASGLMDGDFAVMYANPASGSPVVPEPGPFLLVGTGLLALANLRRRSILASASRLVSARVLGAGAFVMVIGLLLASSTGAHAATTAVKLNAYTSPSAGAAGSTVVTLTGSGFPTNGVNLSTVVVSFENTCGGSIDATAMPNAYTVIIGSSGKLSFTLPGSLSTGLYFLSVAGHSNSGVPFFSANCAEVNVTHTSTTLAACLPSSSLAVLTGTNVTAYVPKGYWEGGYTGVSVVPIEGLGVTPVVIPTSGDVNSCSSNSATGETVCVDNGNNVYEIKASAILNTLTSGSNRYAGFSGGSCHNCGVAIDALTNTAVISGGFSGNSSGDGFQLLNLANNTFSAPFPTAYEVTENASIDPNRNLILSPDEANVYDLIKINPNGTLTEYANQPGGYGEFDSAAEDCTTGIALATEEFSSYLYISDLTQATFTPPSGGHTYGTWTAPGQHVYLNTYGFSAGTSGISVAAGTTHLGITTGEFGGSTFAVFQLPATSGTGTPNFVDYAGAIMPNTPDSYYFSAGYDPHTITAYTSPNNGKAYGLISDWAKGPPSYVGVIDLQALLNAPRTSAHTVDSSYDLIAHGVVRYVPVP